eukprot:CAMPEP_0185254584 /NCGR_PEP_ID=MMETSP1359-20130426/3442_1 /TAXON_ID=552665 /ORGANISM="Bigelowiella longifila, Strain CCMP242" /LENGTH=134 /DNA_ID=CAMNT_0027837765 /DNA_START=51 /DNA_END=458 /DNA_ORIENTATION=+
MTTKRVSYTEAMKENESMKANIAILRKELGDLKKHASVLEEAKTALEDKLSAAEADSKVKASRIASLERVVERESIDVVTLEKRLTEQDVQIEDIAVKNSTLIAKSLEQEKRAEQDLAAMNDMLHELEAMDISF